MLPLRYPLLWSVPAWGLVAAVIYGTLSTSTVVSVADYDKLAHAFSYFMLMIWFAGLYPSRRFAIIALVLIVLGFVLDALQLGTSTRAFELADVAANAVGVGIGFAVSITLTGGWCQRVERWLARSA